MWSSIPYYRIIKSTFLLSVSPYRIIQNDALSHAIQHPSHAPSSPFLLQSTFHRPLKNCNFIRKNERITSTSARLWHALVEPKKRHVSSQMKLHKLLLCRLIPNRYLDIIEYFSKLERQICNC